MNSNRPLSRSTQQCCNCAAFLRYQPHRRAKRASERAEETRERVHCRLASGTPPEQAARRAGGRAGVSAHYFLVRRSKTPKTLKSVSLLWEGSFLDRFYVQRTPGFMAECRSQLNVVITRDDALSPRARSGSASPTRNDRPVEEQLPHQVKYYSTLAIFRLLVILKSRTYIDSV